MSVSGPVESFSFVGEKAARSAASALRKLKPLAEALPAARLFQAISSLSDISAQSAIEYEKAAIATLQKEIAEAEIAISRANALADQLNAHLAIEVPIPLPNFFRRKN